MRSNGARLHHLSRYNPGRLFPRFFCVAIVASSHRPAPFSSMFLCDSGKQMENPDPEPPFESCHDGSETCGLMQ